MKAGRAFLPRCGWVASPAPHRESSRCKKGRVDGMTVLTGRDVLLIAIAAIALMMGMFILPIIPLFFVWRNVKDRFFFWRLSRYYKRTGRIRCPRF